MGQARQCLRQGPWSSRQHLLLLLTPSSDEAVRPKPPSGGQLVKIPDTGEQNERDKDHRNCRVSERLSGDCRNIRVSFEADSEDAWVDIVDRAVEIASKELTLVNGLRPTFASANDWGPTGVDTLNETLIAADKKPALGIDSLVALATLHQAINF